LTEGRPKIPPRQWGVIFGVPGSKFQIPSSVHQLNKQKPSKRQGENLAAKPIVSLFPKVTLIAWKGESLAFDTIHKKR
jgi:hypothetical protein